MTKRAIKAQITELCRPDDAMFGWFLRSIRGPASAPAIDLMAATGRTRRSRRRCLIAATARRLTRHATPLGRLTTRRCPSSTHQFQSPSGLRDLIGRYPGGELHRFPDPAVMEWLVVR
jgi:hypothetical protein